MKMDFRGKIPESWICVDCGVNKEIYTLERANK
jgi:hypothetical protein